MAKKVYAADFETTPREDDCRVWLWGFTEVGLTDVEWGTDIESFIREISQEDSLCYFHNLKFDGVFIIYWLLVNGYRHAEKATYPFSFETLIDKMGKYYSMRVYWENGNITEFRDSLKKLPFSIKAIAQSWDLPMLKGDIDHEILRPVGHVPTAEELEYLFKDVQIMSLALKTQIDAGMKKLTVGSDSMAEYKRIISPTRFKRYFPVLNNEIDLEIRQAYRGGYTYSDPRFKGYKTGAGSVYDVNSLYPSVMRYKTLPYGEPVFAEGLPEQSAAYPLFIVSMTFTAKLKPGYVPIIQIKASTMFSESEYQTVIDEPVTLTFTSVDLEMVFEHYDIDVISYNGGYRFKARRGLFDDYIDKWAKVKAENKGAKKQIAKLHLNSLYGKFASNPDVTGKYPVLEDGVVKLKLDREAERDPVYTAMGAFITAYARQVTITAVQMNYDRFAYCDTDSLHLMGTEPPKGIEIDDDELGKWAHEADFTAAWYVRAKAYIELITPKPVCKFNKSFQLQKYDVHIAGVPTDIARKLTFGDIFDDHKIGGKLVPKNVPGGTILRKTHFTLKT